MNKGFYGTEPYSVQDHNEFATQAEPLDKEKIEEIKLQDIEEQLEMAESRCNNLKDQLDYMKQVYGVSKPTSKTRKISNLSEKKSSDESISSGNDFKAAQIVPNRQKSNAIATDSSGAAVRTINNILNGITNSVNRLSQIAETPRTLGVTTNISPEVRITTTSKDPAETSQIVPEIKLDDIDSTSRTQKRKAKDQLSKNKAHSQHTFKRSAKFEKKPRNNLSRSTLMEKKSSGFLKKRYFNKLATKGTNLVELYHNDAVKNSDSDEGNPKKSRQQEQRSIKSTAHVAEIPPLNIEMNNNKERQYEHRFPNKSAKTEAIASTHCYDPPDAPRTAVSCCYSRNYELPTVASRMKQVAKSYMGTLNLKTIPFCAAISTTQSHNIGINIQQVMNIIKNRQSISGISPTLAHNIGLAAEKLNSRPFSALVSSINSRLGTSASKCPLSKTFLNIPQLQEQAKTIPEDAIEEVEEENVESPQTNTIIITGPSGDMEIKNKKVPVWAVDKNANEDRCTCMTTHQATVGLPQTASRFHKSDAARLPSQVVELHPRKRIAKPKNLNKYSLKYSTQAAGTCQASSKPKVAKDDNSGQLKSKERNLKEVLTNLHGDFEELNKKYEELSEKSNTDGNQEAVEELERLETELTKKEEEITMVMTLYKEVLALKQQVKQLKEMKSQASIPAKEAKENRAKFKDYNNPEAAFHLTKLLKQIQHYQMRYKTNLSVE